MRYSFYGETNVGKVRDHNEDAFLTSDAHAFGMVSDGMGGLAAGEVASQITKDSVNAAFEKADPEETALSRIVSNAITDANTNVRKAQKEKPEASGMGCTCVLLDFRKKEYVIGYVGDSRIYRYRDNQLHQLSVDHSYVEELFQRGLISAEEKSTHPYKNSITRYVGHEDTIKVDVSSGPLKSGDRFLLCSDGLHGEVTDTQIASVLRDNMNPKDCVEILIKMALEHGGKDNVSVVVASVENDLDEISSGQLSGEIVHKKNSKQKGLLQRFLGLFIDEDDEEDDEKNSLKKPNLDNK